MQDSTRAKSRFLEIRLRNGGIKNLAVSDIKSVQNRAEGGSAIRLQNDRTPSGGLPGWGGNESDPTRKRRGRQCSHRLK